MKQDEANEQGQEETKELTHYDKVQIIFQAIQQLYQANKKPTEATIWLLVQSSGITKEDVHSYTWHLREEELDA
jgi:hypothetical protein